MRRVKFWSGHEPDFDAAIVMTAYMAAATLEEAIRSVFEQRVPSGLSVQLIIGVDPSTDGTLQLARELAVHAPPWLSVEVYENELPNIVLGGRRTARSNFLNCYSKICASVVLYLNCDDAWRTKTKLYRQIAHVKDTGRACCTSLESEAPVLKKINDEAVVRDPFRHGTTVLFSSFATPYFPLPQKPFWWTVPFLDLPIICYCWQTFGIDRLTDEVTFYRINEGGGWSSQDRYAKFRLIRSAVLQMVRGGPYTTRNKWRLWRWLRSQRP